MDKILEYLKENMPLTIVIIVILALIIVTVIAMIVIGGKNSSNTQKLYEICLNECKNTYYIQTLGDFDPESVNSVRSVGITAGASTPKKIIEEVHTRMAEQSFAELLKEEEESTKPIRTGEIVTGQVIEVSKDVFKIDGRFDSEHIYPGSVVPLMNADGARFNGTIAEVKDTTVTVDLNHPLAGKALNFVGEVTENRDATKDEIQGMLNMLSGEGGCGCGCDSCGGCDDDCGCDGHHHGGGCGHCH